MKKRMMLFLFCFMLLACTGCNEENHSFTSVKNATITTTIANPTAQEILITNPSANIFVWKGIVYEGNIDWVNENTYTAGEFLGLIAKNWEGIPSMAHAHANLLPIGTKIYQSKEDRSILIAEMDGEFYYYYALLEG